MSLWRVVTSKIPRRAGEAFLLRNNQFVLKVYKDSCPEGAEVFAEWLASQLNHVEERREERQRENAP